MEKNRETPNPILEETYDSNDILSPNEGCFLVIFALPFIIIASPFIILLYVLREITGSSREKKGLTRYK